MKVEVEIEDYDREKGIQLKWEEGYSIKVESCNGQVVILGNRAGLISLANHLITLAQDGIVEGGHIHLDEYNSLEKDSAELIIERII